MNTIQFNRLIFRISFDKKALEKLYICYFRKIVFHLSQFYGKELSEDVAQEFFSEQIYNTKIKYVKNPAIWMYTCCENIAKRKIMYESRYQNVQTGNFSKRDVREEELYGELSEVIETLDSTSQSIIKLLYWEGYSQEEIALKLNLKAPNVRQKHRRALKKIKKFL